MIRLYGYGYHYGAWRRVTRGLEYALNTHRSCAGVYLADEKEDVRATGEDARTGVVVGDYSILHAALHFQHERLWWMVAPNAYTLPQYVVQLIRDLHHEGKLTGVLTPSRFGEDICSHALSREVPVRRWVHGVDPRLFHRDPVADAVREREYADQKFRVLSVITSDSKRKGVDRIMEVVERSRSMAWFRVEHTIACHPELREKLAIDQMSGVAQWRSSLSMSDEEYVQLLRQHHLVLYPSRVEGFGLVPLEARASGVTVLSTWVTGLAEHQRIVPNCSPGLFPWSKADDIIPSSNHWLRAHKELQRWDSSDWHWPKVIGPSMIEEIEE